MGNRYEEGPQSKLHPQGLWCKATSFTFQLIGSKCIAPLGMSGMEEFQANVFMQSSSDDETLHDKGGALLTLACMHLVFLVQFQSLNVHGTVPPPLFHWCYIVAIGWFLHWAHLRLVALNLFPALLTGSAGWSADAGPSKAGWSSPFNAQGPGGSPFRKQRARVCLYIFGRKYSTVFTAHIWRTRAISGIMPFSFLVGVLVREEFYRDLCDPKSLKLRRKQLREEKRKVQFQTFDTICILHPTPLQLLLIRVGSCRTSRSLALLENTTEKLEPTRPW